LRNLKRLRLSREGVMGKSLKINISRRKKRRKREERNMREKSWKKK